MMKNSKRLLKNNDNDKSVVSLNLYRDFIIDQF